MVCGTVTFCSGAHLHSVLWWTASSLCRAMRYPCGARPPAAGLTTRHSLLRAKPSKDGDAESRGYSGETPPRQPGRQRDMAGGPFFVGASAGRGMSWKRRSYATTFEPARSVGRLPDDTCFRTVAG